ncbi:MAG TPA: type II secretion system protein GspE [Elusimicrobia bacterium]|jgi:type IV pilus assembly protein PilB|nr:type II secretion system protein GspE [Elusimicrobiota bacterium]
MAKTTKKKTINDVFLEGKIVNEKQLEQAVTEAKKTGQPLQQVVVDLGLAKKNEVLAVLAKEWNIPTVNLGEIELDPDVVKIIPEVTARRQLLLSFAKDEKILSVALVNPKDFFVIEDIRLRTGFEVKPYLALPKDILDALNKIHGGDALSKILSQVKTGEELTINPETGTEAERVDITEVDVNTPEVEKLVNAIILGAIEQGASDIHIEPFEGKLYTRYRADGVLRDATFSIPYAYRSAIIAKIKIMTQSMDITERRRPQDGRISITAGNRPLEFRVNIIPTVYGESCVMRILDRGSVRVELSKLGFLPDTLEKLEASIHKPYGLILVSGPTGSGKSTTLYAALNKVNTPEVKILTAENPVEYNLEGVVQVNINQEIGFDFASALRAFLRQDPDIIMVGEIRDKETGVIAMEAAMTGHLVFSTIHTNDAPLTVARLSEMGVHTFLIASTLECVLAQRLVRKTCADCKEQIKPSAEVVKSLEGVGIDPKTATIVRGKGCGTCKGSGYKGRMGIHELLVASEEIRSLLLKETASGPIRELARKQGMRSLWEDGMIKVAKGHTTFEEVFRVCQ